MPSEISKQGKEAYESRLQLSHDSLCWELLLKTNQMIHK